MSSRHRDDHIDHLPPAISNPALRYFRELGFPIGKGKQDDSDYQEGLCNSPLLRYQLNAIHHARLGDELGRKIFHAGNVETFDNLEMELAIQQAVLGAGFNYYRLASFYFRSQVETVLQLKRDEDVRR